MNREYYINVNKCRQNLYLKLISAIHNLFYDNAIEDYNNKPRQVINYYNLHYVGKPLNNSNNLDFFSTAFPALFSYRDKNYIAS